MDNENQNNNGLQKAASGAKKVAKVAKAGAQAASGNIKPLLKIVIPVLFFITFGIFIFTILFTAWLFAPKDDGLSSFESDKEIETEKFRQGIVDTVVDAYEEADKDCRDRIDKMYKESKKGYDGSEYKVVDPLENASIMQNEIYKVYAMFSVYKDREYLIEKAANPDMEMQDEAELYDIKDLKKMLKDKSDKLLIIQETRDVSYEYETVWDEELQQNVIDETKEPKTYCRFTYTITVKPIDTVGPSIFGLQDLTNTTDASIPQEARINEVETAGKKVQSLNEIFEGVLNEYSGSVGENGYKANKYNTGGKDLSDAIEKYTIPSDKINFSVTQKMAVPLGGSYRYSGSSQADFGWRIHPIKKKMVFHTGIDIGAGEGIPIYSVANGYVVAIGTNDSYGNYIIVYHGEINGTYYFTTYNHMLNPSVREVGDFVDTNTLLGRVGSTGLSTGNHLHFEVRTAVKDGNSYKFSFVNPELFIDVRK